MNKLSESAIKYIGYLNLELEKPSYEYLEQICGAHLNTFPFENISKLINYKNNNHNNCGVPSFEIFINNYDEFNFGGTCYTLNSNILILLKELGFECYNIMLGDIHMGIIVIIDNKRFYVDCGATAPFFKPVSFETNPHNRSYFGGDEVRLLPVNLQKNTYEYVRYTNGIQNGDIWGFNSRKESNINDFCEVIEKSNKPNALFMSILRCHLYQTEKQRSVSLINNKFVIRTASGELIVRRLASIQEVSMVIHEEFLLPKLPVIEAFDVLNNLNIDIFADNNSLS